MRVVGITGGGFADFVLESMWKYQDADVIAFAYDLVGEIDFVKENSQETNIIYDLTVLSEDMKTCVLAGADTAVLDAVRRSVAVLDRGNVLGVSDGVFVRRGERYSAGFSHRVYDTSAGRIGVVVGDDILRSDSCYVLKNAGAEVVICISDRKLDKKIKDYALASSLINSIDILLLCKNGGMVARRGEESECSFEPIFECNIGEYDEFMDLIIKASRNI